jgi:hypothetical protein
VTKLSSAGALLYSTFLGGSSADQGYSIAVDGDDNAYITGYTLSLDFPTLNAYDNSYAGDPINSGDAYVTKLSSAGALVYSTFLGDSGNDSGLDLAVDSDGNAYITGTTSSGDFPTLAAYDSSYNGGSVDVFVTKLSSAGALVYSTFLGGSSGDQGYSIAADEGGNVYVTGYTQSTDFPTFNAYDSSLGGSGDAFVTKLFVGSPAIDASAQLRLGTAFATPGDTVRIPFTMTSDTPVGGLQGLVIPDSPAHAELIALEDSTTGLGFTATENTSNDTTSLVVHSAASEVIPPGSHTLAYLRYAIDPAASFGETIALSLAGVEIGDSAGVALDDSTVNGQIQLGLRGDVNRDGRISILDVIRTARIIVGKDPLPEEGTTDFAIADMNRDGTISVNDIILQVNTILGIPSKPIAGPSQSVAVRLDMPIHSPDGRLMVPLVLATDGLVAGFQAALSFDPARLVVGIPELTEATLGLSMDSHVADGRLRLVVYAVQAGQGIGAGTHTVVRVPVMVLEGQGGSPPALSLVEMVIAGPQAQNVPVLIETPSVLVTARGAGLPTAFALHDARPNPFNPSTQIAYEVPQQAHVQLIVYNLLGQEVVRLVDGVKLPGRYVATWDGRNTRGEGIASGVYLYRLTSSTGYTQTRRITLLK